MKTKLQAPSSVFCLVHNAFLHQTCSVRALHGGEGFPISPTLLKLTFFFPLGGRDFPTRRSILEFYRDPEIYPQGADFLPSYPLHQPPPDALPYLQEELPSSPATEGSTRDKQPIPKLTLLKGLWKGPRLPSAIHAPVHRGFPHPPSQIFRLQLLAPFLWVRSCFCISALVSNFNTLFHESFPNSHRSSGREIRKPNEKVTHLRSLPS